MVGFFRPFQGSFSYFLFPGVRKKLTPGYQLIAPVGACFSLPKTLK
jgi:hypothetical protein